MRSTPNPPQIEWGNELHRFFWEQGWREGFKAALKSITTTQEKLPFGSHPEDNNPLPLTLDGEKW